MSIMYVYLCVYLPRFEGGDPVTYDLLHVHMTLFDHVELRMN